MSKKGRSKLGCGRMEAFPPSFDGHIDDTMLCPEPSRLRQAAVSGWVANFSQAQQAFLDEACTAAEGLRGDGTLLPLAPSSLISAAWGVIGPLVKMRVSRSVIYES